jgi:hypothetical protein
MSFDQTSTEDLKEDLYHAENSLSETQAEAANEVAMFGDSWPGSADQISAIHTLVERLRAEVARRCPVVAPNLVTSTPVDPDDIPF